MGDKSENKRAGEILGEAVGESERQVQRYIRLTNLIPELLDLVDEKQIAMRPAVEISYFTPEAQMWLFEAINQRMKNGTYAFRYNLLGYRKGADGQPEIVPEEAEIIRKIFNMYVEGLSIRQICQNLEANGYKTKSGKSDWDGKIHPVFLLLVRE